MLVVPLWKTDHSFLSLLYTYQTMHSTGLNVLCFFDRLNFAKLGFYSLHQLFLHLPDLERPGSIISHMLNVLSFTVEKNILKALSILWQGSKPEKVEMQWVESYFYKKKISELNVRLMFVDALSLISSPLHAIHKMPHQIFFLCLFHKIDFYGSSLKRTLRIGYTCKIEEFQNCSRKLIILLEKKCRRKRRY